MDMVYNLPDRGEVRFDLPTTDNFSPAERIWQGFLRLHAQDLVMRSGVALCGVYSEKSLESCKLDETQSTTDLFSSPVIEISMDNRQNYTKKGLLAPESVSLHTHSCAILTFLLTQEFPELFCRDHSHNPSDNSEIVHSLCRLNNLFYFHDSAEPIIGDIPDDNSVPKLEKAHKELTVILKNVALLGHRGSRTRILNDYVNFIYPKARDLYASWTEFDGELAQIASTIDKGEAVLTCLRDESLGHAGHLSSKPKNFSGLSSQDQEYINFCETDNISDCWAAHFIDLTHNFCGFRPMIQVIHAAVIDIRGTWYPWWDKICQKNAINPKILEP